MFKRALKLILIPLAMIISIIGTTGVIITLPITYIIMNISFETSMDFVCEYTIDKVIEL